MRLLPSGNYILASGGKKKGFGRKAGVGQNGGPTGTATAAATAAPSAVSNGSAATAAPTPAPGAHKVTLIPAKGRMQPQQQQTLLQSRSVAPAALSAATTNSQSSASAATNGSSSSNVAAVAAAHPPHASPQKLHQQNRQQPASGAAVAATVLMSAEVAARRRKKLQFRQLKFMTGRVVPRHRLPGSMAGAIESGKSSEVERGRPISQRKKFKKNLGPDFLQPSDLGMQYLQNSFEPKCDYCDRPASRSPRNKHEEFLVCKDCGFKAHPKSCLKYSEELISRCRESDWQCQYCKDCCMCDKSGDVESILFCDACDQGYHMACHNPPLASKPDGAWICTYCQLRRKTGAKPVIPKAKAENNGASDDGFDEESEEMLDSEIEEEDEEVEEMDAQSCAPAANVTVTASKGKDSTERIISLLQPPLEKMTESQPNLAAKPKDWTVDDVESFIRFVGFNDQAAIFREQEIDGVALLLLKRSDLLSGMDLKLGPAVKIYGHIQRLQTIHARDDVVDAIPNGTTPAQA